MTTARIIALATLSTLKTVQAQDQTKVQATAKGLTFETTWREGDTLATASARALTGLLGKVDAVSELLDKLGPKPPPQKPRGIAAARTQTRAVEAAPVEEPVSQNAPTVIPGTARTTPGHGTTVVINATDEPEDDWLTPEGKSVLELEL